MNGLGLRSENLQGSFFQWVLTEWKILKISQMSEYFVGQFDPEWPIYI